MTKYLIKRLIRGLISVVIAITVIMILVYALSNRNDIFKKDPVISKMQSNERITYRYEKWEEYGYLDYVTYADYLTMLVNNGELDSTTRDEAAVIGKTADKDSDLARVYTEKFKSYYESKGYQTIRLDADMERYWSGGKQVLFAYKDIPIFTRLWDFFTGLLEVDSIHYVENDEDLVTRQEDGTYVQTKRGLTFTFYDPAYGGKKFSPAIIGNGTKHKYLLYFDNKFPFIHQNVVKIHLGQSFAINQGVDVAETMIETQGTIDMKETIFPTGYSEISADNLHSATFSAKTNLEDPFYTQRYIDKYANVSTDKKSMSRIALSFTLGILAAIMSYLIGVPAGIAMARNKDKWYDKLSTAYIVFIVAVPSLAYIFMFRELGIATGLPGRYDTDSTSPLQYVLPIVSLALPSIAGLMRWLRRYMIDQMNSDYVKFARSGGMSERGIFSRHIFKNAVIPLVQGIPGTVLGALVGAFITETVYAVPGTGRMLTDAITQKDNAVIIGLAGFYGLLSVISLILGDILMAMVDPRISFSDKAR